MFPEVVMMSDPESFWHDLLLHSAGPALFSFIAALAALVIANRFQTQREANELRSQLIKEVTDAAATFYLQTQRFWRARTEADLDARKKQFEDWYQDFRAKGEVLEAFLGVVFFSQLPRCKWHGVIDLLTVRYFQLIGLATDQLLRANATGAKKVTDPTPDHSGLTVDELRNPGQVLDAYRERLSEVISLVLALKLKPGARGGATATIHPLAGSSG
jgi:hypothetical protein